MSGTDLHVIIPAGGAGTRLWPLSRRSRPKFLLDLTGSGRTLLQATVDRLTPRAASITIVTGAAHRGAVLGQLPEFNGHPDRHLVIEPSGRDSMPAIGLATYLVRRRYGADAVVGSFAADHLITGPDVFLAALDTAVGAAREGYVTTIGITPTEPSTAYGYIHPGADLPGVPGAQLVTSFVEKPDPATARRHLGEGYVWNAGMFVMRAGVLTDHLARLRPDLDRGLERIANAWGGHGEQAVLEETWPTLERIAIDHAVAEPVAAQGGVAVVPTGAGIGWTDLGDFRALGEVRGEVGDALRVDAPGTVVYTETGQRVVLVGVEDLVVVTTPDAVLVTRDAAAQEVKRAVDALGEEGRSDLL